MTDLVKRLRIKAGVIEMGEMIAWGSDSALMREAADALEMAAPAMQGEPVGRVKTVGGYPDESEHTVEWLCKYRDLKDGDLLYTAPQPAEQQPAPDVAELVEALEWYSEQVLGCRKITSEGEQYRTALDRDGGARARAALAAYRRGGEQ